MSPYKLKSLAFVIGLALPTTSYAQERPHLNIHIMTLPHAHQRYDTVGDWRFREGGSLSISVSQMSDERYEFLVGLHELVEAYLCKRAGVTQEQVDAFDTGPGKDLDDPGNDPRAPYHAQHVQAMQIELKVADWLDVDWHEYSDEIESLSK